MDESGLIGDYDSYLDGFDREVVERFARVGVYPPPYAGDDRDPESVLFHLADQERWTDPPSLVGTDEEGVERQMVNFAAMVYLGLRQCDAARDPVEFGRYHN
jgi:hypothetical protein